MQCGDERDVDLQQRLAAGQHDKSAMCLRGPHFLDGVGQIVGRTIAAAPRAVGSDEIRVAEGADRVGAVGLVPGPQIAAGEPAQHRDATGLRALALQGLEYLFHRIGHGRFVAQ